MTEDEAKKKWCPMVRFVIGHNDSTWQGNAYTNRGEVMDPPRSLMCIASDCMMWRPTDNEVKSRYPGDPNAIINPSGYCGLAGNHDL